MMADQSMADSSTRVRIYISSVLVLCVVAGVLVVTVSIALPEKDNTGLIATVIGIFAPVSAGLMALALKENHDTMNSRLSQLLALTEKASKAEGVLVGQTGPLQNTGVTL